MLSYHFYSFRRASGLSSVFKITYVINSENSCSVVNMKTKQAINDNGNREKIYPPEKTIREFRADLLENMGKIALARESTRGLVSAFGSARTTQKDRDYQLVQETFFELGAKGYGAITGGGPGVMEAANLGAIAAGEPSIGVQPKFLGDSEQSMEIGDKKQYYVYSMHSRKVTIYANSVAMIFFPGGFGTMDELFENLVLTQVNKMKGVPTILMGNEKYWQGLISWLERAPYKLGFISKKDLGQLKFASSPKEALRIIESSGIKPVAHSAEQLVCWFDQDMRRCHQALGQLVHPLVSIFGASRVNGGNYYKSAMKLANRLSSEGYAICSGGGSGIMEAVSKGVVRAGTMSYGLIPTFFYEREKPNPRESNHILMNMMASRKLVLGSSDALVFFPGGFGTMDELFEFAVRVQINDMKNVPIITVGKAFWGGLYSWLQKYPVEMGLINRDQMNVIQYVDTPQQAIRLVEFGQG